MKFDSNPNGLWVQTCTYSMQFSSQLPAFDSHQQASGRLLAEFITTPIERISEVQLNRYLAWTCFVTTVHMFSVWFESRLGKTILKTQF